MADKTSWRKAMRAVREKLSREESLGLSRSAQEKILREEVWVRSATVALYVPVCRETDTGLLLEAAWEQGKTVLLPCTPKGSKGKMHFLPCAEGQQLIHNHYGIPEPDPQECRPAPELGWTIDLVVVPGLAFDRRGYRVGAGGGYYDRFLAGPGLEKAIRVGLAYGFQVLEQNIVENEWDVPMHAVASEEGVLWV